MVIDVGKPAAKTKKAAKKKQKKPTQGRSRARKPKQV